VTNKAILILLLPLITLGAPAAALPGAYKDSLRTAILNLEDRLQKAQAAQGPLCEPEMLARAQTCLAAAKEEFQEGDYWEAEDILETCRKASDGLWERILACGRDADVDGIPDPKDGCPDAPETYNGYRDLDGCPDRIPERAVLSSTGIEIIEPLRFDDASQRLLPSCDPVLRDVARVLSENPAIRIEIQAHLDDSVPPERALEITGLRAAEVKKALAALGVAPDRLDPVGMGNRVPVAPNDSAAGRQVNQRVEFVRNQ